MKVKLAVLIISAMIVATVFAEVYLEAFELHRTRWSRRWMGHHDKSRSSDTEGNRVGQTTDRRHQHARWWRWSWLGAHADQKGDPYTIIVFSPPLLLINLTGQTQYSFRDLTPLAMLIHDYGAFAVSKKSKYNTISEVMDALKKDPKSVKVGGISAFGSMDHIQFLMAAKAAGVTNLKDITYVSFQEGEHLAALLGGHIDVLSTGLAEVTAALQTGTIKVLAITAPQRVHGTLATVPTLKEEGIDAEFVNWRGLFGPPEMPDYAVEYWINTLSKMVQTIEWDRVVAKYNWTKAFMPGKEFMNYLEKVNEDYKVVLKELGLYKGE